MAKNVTIEEAFQSSSTPLVSRDSEPEESSNRQKKSWLRNIYGRLSSSRQLFCLFCIFDFVFTFFLWIIYAQGVSVTGLDDSLSSEIEHYGISSSLFDVVLLSIARVIILLVVYGYYMHNKAYAVLFTTSVSTIYLIVKASVFEFDSNKKDSGNRPVDYLLHIGSFILCWAEIWYFLVKVLPRERKSGQRKDSSDPNYGAIPGASSAYSVLSFHTPPEQDSDEEEQTCRKNLKYIETAREATNKALKFFYAEKQWAIEKQKDDILVESTQDENLGKVLRVRTIINASPDIVYPMVFGVENIGKWNRSLTQIEVLFKVNSTTDITYSAVGEAAGGLISARDFVNIRHIQRIGSMFLSASTSVTTDLKPPIKGIVRGESPLNCYALSPAGDELDKSEFVWITTTTLKPSAIPQAIIDRTMPGYLVECAADLIKCCEAASQVEETET